MKQKRIEIFVFIDALGWKIVKEHKFLADVLPYQQKITMQFGYSSSAIPTILSGKTPAEHGHLGLFRFTLNDSPFKFFSKFAWLFHPECFFNRGRVRHHLSKIVKKIYGFTGYFQLYRMPIWKLKYMDYCEKQNLFVANGMKPCDNLFDTLSKMGVDFHIADWHLSDKENYLRAEKAIEKGKKFLFVYTASLDGVLHNKVNDFEAVQKKLDDMQADLKKLFNKAKEYADEVNFTVISDHGMTPLTGTVDLMNKIESASLIFGKDYGVCYDSTMARFYYLSDKAKELIPSLLDEETGHILSEAEEREYGIYRSDRFFGDAIYLLNAGLQIVPSDMGEKSLNGMHGFSPQDEYSYAAILSNTEIPQNVQKVKDYFDLMIERAGKL